MLAIPTTKCLEGLGDTSTLLKHLVCERFCEDRLVVPDITRLKRMRAAAVSVTEPSDMGQQLLLEYTQQLVRILPKFADANEKFQMNFVWTDAFGSSLTGTSNSFYFELACCIWNIGSFESLLGARLDRSNENAIRAACHRFQRAAGCFDYILTDILAKLPNLTNFPCLSDMGLRMARELMLSQAQLCFYERAVQDMKKGTMKQSIVAKLAKQTSVFYYNTMCFCHQPALTNVLDSLWLSVAQFQSKCFEGAAEYWQAQACRRNADTKNKGHGEDVMRYKNAERYVTEALDNAERSNLTGPLPSSVGTFLQAIRANQAAAEAHLKSLDVEVMDPASPLKEISSVSMVVPAVTRSLTLLHDCTNPLFDFYDPSAPLPAVQPPPIVTIAPPMIAPTPVKDPEEEIAVGQKRPLPTEQSPSSSGSGSGPSVATLSERTISSLSPPKPTAPLGPPEDTADPAYEFLPAPVVPVVPPQSQPLATHPALQQQMHAARDAFPPPVIYPVVSPPVVMAVSAPVLPPAPALVPPHSSGAVLTHAKALSASMHPITGQPVWFYALDFLGIPPQYPLYRLTESSFSIVSGGVLHEATSFDYERSTRRLRCHVFIWDFDVVFAPDMSCIESGVCLQHSDRSRGIPRDFWTYQSTTDIDNNKLHIVRCGPNGQPM